MANRLLLHLHHVSCPCQSAQRLLDRLTARVKPIEAITNDAIEFWMPSVSEVADEGIAEIGFTLRDFRPEAAPIDADLPMHVSTELRRIALKLTEAADRVGSLAGGKEVA